MKSRSLLLLLTGLALIAAGWAADRILAYEGILRAVEGVPSREITLQRVALIARDIRRGTAQSLTLPDPADTASGALPGMVLAGGSPVRLDVDEFLPRAVPAMRVEPGEQRNPAVLLALEGPESGSVWLLAHDAERSAVEWQGVTVRFTEIDQAHWHWMENPESLPPRGAIVFSSPEWTEPRVVPVSESAEADLPGSPYRVRIHEYFNDLAIDSLGVRNQSDEPRNPAVSFVIDGPQGREARMLFALHPEFELDHGRKTLVPVSARYIHPAALRAPAGGILLALDPEDRLHAVGAAGDGMRPMAIGETLSLPGTAAVLRIERYIPWARVEQVFLSDASGSPALRARLRDGARETAVWLGLPGAASVALGERAFLLELGPKVMSLPFAVQARRIVAEPGAAAELSVRADGKGRARRITTDTVTRLHGYAFRLIGAEEGIRPAALLRVSWQPGAPLTALGILALALAAAFGLSVRKQAGGAVSAAGS